MLHILSISVSVVMICVVIFWVGLRIPPRSFPTFPGEPHDMSMVDYRVDLPSPVEHFFRQIYAERIPVIQTAVISGRARLRIFGLFFPCRFRFTYQAGQSYKHYIEATFWGFPVMKVNERFIDGVSRMELPIGVVEDDPKVNQAANVGLWAESVWLPSILVTDPRVNWFAVNDHTALLEIPFGAVKETFVIRFDPNDRLLRYMEIMRYKGEKSEAKVLWVNEAIAWQELNRHKIPNPASVTWMDESTPWSIWTIEEVLYNVDIGESLTTRGL